MNDTVVRNMRIRLAALGYGGLKTYFSEKGLDMKLYLRIQNGINRKKAMPPGLVCDLSDALGCYASHLYLSRWDGEVVPANSASCAEEAKKVAELRAEYRTHITVCDRIRSELWACFLVGPEEDSVDEVAHDV